MLTIHFTSISAVCSSENVTAILCNVKIFQVRQMHLVVPLDKHFSLLYTLLKEHIADDVNYKVSKSINSLNFIVFLLSLPRELQIFLKSNQKLE